MDKDKGASVPDRALVNEADKSSSPQSGFDPSRMAQLSDLFAPFLAAAVLAVLMGRL